MPGSVSPRLHSLQPAIDCYRDDLPSRLNRNTAGSFCFRSGERLPGRTRTTGHGANRATRSATLPIKYLSNPVRPRVESMIESHFDSRAAATISSAGWPTRTSKSAGTFSPTFSSAKARNRSAACRCNERSKSRNSLRPNPNHP
jgi:hypothetical protein